MLAWLIFLEKAGFGFRSKPGQHPAPQVTFGTVVVHVESGLSLLSSPRHEGAELEKVDVSQTKRTCRPEA